MQLFPYACHFLQTSNFSRSCFSTVEEYLASYNLIINVIEEKNGINFEDVGSTTLKVEHVIFVCEIIH